MEAFSKADGLNGDIRLDLRDLLPQRDHLHLHVGDGTEKRNQLVDDGNGPRILTENQDLHRAKRVIKKMRIDLRLQHIDLKFP